MKRRLLSLSLVLLLLFPTLLVPLRADGTSFSDVPSRHWAAGEIDRATRYGLVQGVGEGRFGLGEQMTRAQYATLLCRFMKWDMLTPDTGSFSDNQKPTKWYYSAIETAYANGALFVQGDYCQPNEPITREEMSTSLVRALGYQSLSGVIQEDCPFSDVTTNRGYVALAYRMGLVKGVGGGAFDPAGSCTREQAACVLLRAYDRMGVELVTGKADDAPERAVEAISLLGDTTPVPLSPRAPLETVYEAAVRAGEGGAVVLHTAPYAQSVAKGVAGAPRLLKDEQFHALINADHTAVYRSSRYESSYLIHPEADGSSTVVWFESTEDLAAKLDLCRLLGVTAVYLAE